jgi:LPXTG-motif cell wall-anchored protein
VVVAGDAVVITATNFHYSGPTLSVRAVASTPNLPATGAGRMTLEILLAAVLVMMGLVIIGSRRRAID